MREILFRGQTRRKGERTINVAGDKCDSNWVYGGIFPQNKDGDFAIIYQQDPNVQKFTVYADTVGQFTGLFDRNGNKIFEGDIVEITVPLKDTKPIIKKCEVYFCERGFCVKWQTSNYGLSDFAPCVEIEVIGNIHDNPELISGGINAN